MRPPHRAASMAADRISPTCIRPAAVTSALFLTLSAALLIGSLVLTIAAPIDRPATASVDPAASPDLVASFYAELDARLAGLPPTSFARIVSPALIVSPAGAADRSLAEWVRQLRLLQPPGAALRLTPTAQVQQGANVAVTVRIGVAGEPAVDPAPPFPITSSSIDHLTFDRGQVIAYAPGMPLAMLPRTLPPLRLDASPTPMVASLVQMRLAPGARLDDLVAAGPHLLLVERGALTVTWRGAGALLRTTDGDWSRLETAAHDQALTSGDGLLIPAGAAHSLRNDGATPTELLTLVEFPEASLSATYASLVALANPHWIGLARHPAPGVETMALASLVDDVAGCTRTLRVSRVTLAPGDALPAHSVDGVELAAFVSGWLTVGDTPNATHGDPATPGPALGELPQGIAWSAGTAPLLRNDGQVPVTLLDLALEPDRAAPCLQPEPAAPQPTATELPCSARNRSDPCRASASA